MRLRRASVIAALSLRPWTATAIAECVECARERIRASLKRIVITGAMGSAKSTLLAQLRNYGFTGTRRAG